MLLKRIAAALPGSWQFELKRIYYRLQIYRDIFSTPEPEYGILASLVGPGQWAIDIGANIGHYTKRLSDLVGSGGRIIAFEPVPETFALLAANVQLFKYRNVTLINAAVSDKTSLGVIDIPYFQSGIKNYFEAHLTSIPECQEGLEVMTLRVDSLEIPCRVVLCKIDVEGYEFPVLQGMSDLLKRDHPVLIVESGKKEVVELLTNLGYSIEKLPESPNMLFRYFQK